MKNVALFPFLLVVCGATAQAQSTCYIKYTYDAAGNRIQKSFICDETNVPDEPEARPFITANDTSKLNTAIVEQNKNSVNEGYSLVYPNPNRGTFWVEFKTKEQRAVKRKIYVMNAQGQLIFETSTEELKTYIELKSISSGSYFVVVYDGNKNNTHKISVVK